MSEQTFNLVFSVGDIRDLSYGNNNKTYTIDLPLTKRNKRLLKFISQADVKTETSTLGTLFVGDAIAIKGKTVILSYSETHAKIMITCDEWVDALKNRELSDLDFSASNHVLTHASVEDSWTATYPAYRYPMINFGALSSAETGSTAKWNPNDFIPMIRVVDILTKILAPYTIVSTWLATSFVKDLYVLANETIKNESFIQNKDLEMKVQNATDNQVTVSIGAGATGVSQIVSAVVKFNTTVTDEGGSWNGVGDFYEVEETGVYRFKATIVLKNNGNTAPFSEIAGSYSILLKQTGSAARTLATLSASTGVVDGTSYVVDSGFCYMVTGDHVFVELSALTHSTNTSGGALNLIIGPTVDSTIINIWSNANRHTGLNQSVVISDLLPKMSQVDFIAAIREIFNLRFWMDKSRQNLYIEPWDSFITSNVVDITEFIDYENVNVELISPNYYKNIILKWKDDTSDEAYNEYLKSNDSPGKKEITLNSKFTKDGTDTREHQFSAMATGYNMTIGEFTVQVPRIWAEVLSGPSTVFNRKTGFNTRLVEWKGMTSGFTWYYQTETKTTYPKIAGLDYASIYSTSWQKLLHYIDQGKLFTLRMRLRPGFLTQFTSVLNSAGSEAFMATYCIEIAGVKNYFFMQSIVSNGDEADIEMILKQ